MPSFAASQNTSEKCQIEVCFDITMPILWQTCDVKKDLKNPRRLIPAYLVSEIDEKKNTDKTKVAESISTK